MGRWELDAAGEQMECSSRAQQEGGPGHLPPAQNYELKVGADQAGELRAREQGAALKETVSAPAWLDAGGGPFALQLARVRSCRAGRRQKHGEYRPTAARGVRQGGRGGPAAKARR